MDWIRLGLAYRAVRIRRRWRQADLAARAGVSRAVISDVERGHGGRVTGVVLARIAAALDARLDVSLRWHADALDRLLDAAHAGLVERVVEMLGSLSWDTVVEASFAIGGERGSIDVLALHRVTGRLLVIEVKSVVPDHQAMLHALDRKVRLATRIAADRGWEPSGSVARVLVVGEGTTSRRRIEAMAATYAAVLPVRGWDVRRWLREPSGSLAGLLFLPYATGSRTSRGTTGVSRVRTTNTSTNRRTVSPSVSPDGVWRQAGGQGRSDDG